MENKIQIYCCKENLVQVRQFIADYLHKSTSLSDVDIHALVLAVDEVCANVIIHSAQCDDKEILEVTVSGRKDKICFEVIDYGPGYDLRKHNLPTLKEIIKAKRKGGVGLMLVQKIMDEIDFIPGNKRNIIRLIKHV